MLTNPWVIAIINFLVPGLGYLALKRRIVFGALMIVVMAISWITLSYSPEVLVAMNQASPIGTFLVFLISSLAFAYDGYQEAQEAQSQKKSAV